MIDQKVIEARNKDILSYLASRGMEHTKSGNKYFFSSPFSSDSNWSFCVYITTNSFFDWSTGVGGDIITLVRKLEDLNFMDAVDHLIGETFVTIKHQYKKYEDNKNFWKDFDYTRYLTHNVKEIKNIKKYASSRGITNGYECGVFFTREVDNWIRHPSLMFLHRDLDLSIVGAKFRKIKESNHKDDDNGPRFSHRGNQGLYILENYIEGTFEKPTLYLVEGESNANSLWSYLNSISKNAVVISFGGVSSAPSKIPNKYSSLKRKLIIDYDGDDKLYNDRLKSYKHLNAAPIKLAMGKGEDINYLYSENKINLLDNLI